MTTTKIASLPTYHHDTRIQALQLHDVNANVHVDLNPILNIMTKIRINVHNLLITRVARPKEDIMLKVNQNECLKEHNLSSVDVNQILNIMITIRINVRNLLITRVISLRLQSYWDLTSCTVNCKPHKMSFDVFTFSFWQYYQTDSNKSSSIFKAREYEQRIRSKLRCFDQIARLIELHVWFNSRQRKDPALNLTVISVLLV